MMVVRRSEAHFPSHCRGPLCCWPRRGRQYQQPLTHERRHRCPQQQQRCSSDPPGRTKGRYRRKGEGTPSARRAPPSRGQRPARPKHCGAVFRQRPAAAATHCYRRGPPSPSQLLLLLVYPHSADRTHTHCALFHPEIRPQWCCHCRRRCRHRRHPQRPPRQTRGPKSPPRSVSEDQMSR